MVCGSGVRMSNEHDQREFQGQNPTNHHATWPAGCYSTRWQWWFNIQKYPTVHFDSDAMIIQCRHKSRENSAQSGVKVQIKWGRIPHAHFYLLLSLTLIPHDLKLLLDRLAQPAQSCKAALEDFFNLWGFFSIIITCEGQFSTLNYSKE